MVRYFGIHARRAKKAARIAMEKLGLLVKCVIKSFSWRENVKEYTGKELLKCEDCKNEMFLYKMVYQNKNSELREYGGLSMLLKKILNRSNAVYEKEKLQILFGSHQFTCEKCCTGIMNSEVELEIIVRGYGLFEGFERGQGFWVLKS